MGAMADRERVTGISSDAWQHDGKTTAIGGLNQHSALSQTTALRRRTAAAGGSTLNAREKILCCFRRSASELKKLLK